MRFFYLILFITFNSPFIFASLEIGLDNKLQTRKYIVEKSKIKKDRFFLKQQINEKTSAQKVINKSQYYIIKNRIKQIKQSNRRSSQSKIKNCTQKMWLNLNSSSSNSMYCGDKNKKAKTYFAQLIQELNLLLIKI